MPPAGQHRQQRRAVRRLRPDPARHQAPAPLGLPAQGHRAALRQHHLEGQPAQLARAEPRQVPAGPRRAAGPGHVLQDPPPRRRRGPRRQPRRGPVRVHRAQARPVLDLRQPARSVDIPLGRAGATKLQHLMLGKGTSQHVLTAGKTGSGKSTLLHALITNGALRTAPTSSSST